MFSEPESLVTRRRAVLFAGALLCSGLALGVGRPALAAESAVMAPAPALDPRSTALRETAIFAGGCFWGIEGVFSHVKGVLHAESGYAGGTSTRRITYEEVTQGNTGFAESVRVTFDPRVISYGQLLRILFSVGADPTTLNRQGPDIGTHYRTALFPLNPTQDRIARAYLTQMASSGVWKDKIVTRVERNANFHVAEVYHQNFMENNPGNRYIVHNDAPKLAALKRLFPKNYVRRPSS
jgi:peptide-methionine (S)-S-oxide reductase